MGASGVVGIFGLGCADVDRCCDLPGEWWLGEGYDCVRGDVCVLGESFACGDVFFFVGHRWAFLGEPVVDNRSDEFAVCMAGESGT
jgi:hypothetical protein